MGRRWVTGLLRLVGSSSVPVLTASALGLGTAGVLLEQPAYGAGGVCFGCVALLLERRRYYDLEDRLVRLRTRLRVARQRSDGELVELREQVRFLERELWEYRLVDQMGPQARDLIHGMAATLARPYVPPSDLEHEEWDLFDTHPIDLATLQGRAAADPSAEPAAESSAEPEAEPEVQPEAELNAEAEPELDADLEPVAEATNGSEPAEEPPPLPVLRRLPPSPHRPEPPTVDLPVIRPGEPAAAQTVAAQGAVVVDLRTRPAEVDEPALDVRELDEQVYRRMVEATRDELAAALEPPRRTGKPFSGKPYPGQAPADHGATKDPAVKGAAAVPDDPGRRTA